MIVVFMWISRNRYQNFIKIGSRNEQEAKENPWAVLTIYKRERDTEMVTKARERIMTWSLKPTSEIKRDIKEMNKAQEEETMNVNEGEMIAKEMTTVAEMIDETIDEILDGMIEETMIARETMIKGIVEEMMTGEEAANARFIE